ncbi:hypothetical protein PFISCL1PPCAC_24424 [Pristionchus fissidentatus]|uniref:Serrate RNA effector molecule homolog n=1 Tax=Pristionchus fissidentatus TaxID=1538716 RepID=A0AAV5WMB3_9BILA|nr:hypothetical protein PFISCL1PPCAC_24424 [Pristionchus fissidentatus]
MADSEDDERRGGRVDKFTREREYGGGDRRRDDDRRGGYRGGNDYGNGGIKRAAPSRRDDYPMDSKRNRQGSEAEDASAAANAVPVLLPFKKWLVQQDDSINEDDATSKYAEYKLEHKKQLLLKFFNTHKDEEWFRQKYHPEESTKRKDEQKHTITKRNEIFKELHEKGFFNEGSLDMPNAEKIIFIMDAVVVKLEGGSDEDVELLRQQKVEDDVLAEIGKKETEVAETETTDNENGEVKKKKMHLHKTTALFLRNVEANIKQSEVEEVCNRYPGFLRLCLSEPVADKKFARKGWATYKKDVNIKQIALNINSIRIRDTDLHAIINKDLTRKIRTVNGVTAHSGVAQNDLRVATKLAALYDHRSGLYSDAPEADRECDIQVGVDLVGTSPNPIIKIARGRIVDELSPEEEELMGKSGQNGKSDGLEKFPLQRDEELLKTLDLVIWYLRIVHSVDFYTHSDYVNEDKMPNRCSLIHLRGQPPSGSQFETDEEGKTLITSKFVNDFSATFKNNVEKLTARAHISDEEIAKLGKKNPDDEVEAFIKVNSVELSAEKWLCPLSGKKFKGPEFIRKHLQSKHVDKLEEAKQDAFFYNTYLADPSRPVEPEAPPPPAREERHEERPRYEDRNFSENNYGGDRPRYSGPPRNEYNNRRSLPGGRYHDAPPPPSGADNRQFRPPVSYRDLDAPDDVF